MRAGSDDRSAQDALAGGTTMEVSRREGAFMPRTSPSRKHYPELAAPPERRRAALKPTATPRELPSGPDDSHRGDDSQPYDYELQDG